MQDKNYIEDIDKQFTNTAWEKMQGILDKEMPVTPVSKRRWGWLWLLLFLLFLLAGTYYNFFIKNAAPTTATPNTPIADIIENPQSTTTLAQENETENSTIAETSKISDKTNILPSNTDIQTPEKEVILTEKTIQKITKNDIIENNLQINKNIYNNNKNVNNNSFFNNKKNVENNEVEKITGTSKVPVISDAKVPIISDIPSSNEVVKNIEAIPNTTTSSATPTAPMNKQNPPVSDLASPNPPKENQPESTERKDISTASVATISIVKLTPQIPVNQELAGIDPIPKPRKFSQEYSWLAGANSDEFKGFGGATTGLLAHYRFTPKIGLETGLMYANVRKKIDTDVDYTGKVNELYVDNTEQFRTTIANNFNLHYLQLPLRVTYRPHTKIQFFTGLNVGYYLSNVFGNSNLLNDTVTTYEGESDTNSVSVGLSSEITINTNNLDGTVAPGTTATITVPYSVSIRKMDMTAQAGVRYYPIPRLGIDLRYQQGLINMTESTTKNFHSGVQLALVYRLHR